MLCPLCDFLPSATVCDRLNDTRDIRVIRPKRERDDACVSRDKIMTHALELYLTLYDSRCALLYSI